MKQGEAVSLDIRTVSDIPAFNNLYDLEIPGAQLMPDVEFDDPEIADIDELDLQEAADDLQAETDYSPTVAAFYEGVNAYVSQLRKIKESTSTTGLSEEDQLIINAVPYIAHQVRKNHKRPTHRLSMTDRIQNGNLELTKFVKKSYDPTIRASVIAGMKKLIYAHISNYERGWYSKLDQGEIIRVPQNRKGYYKVRNLLEGLSIKFGRHMTLEEAQETLNFTIPPEHVADYYDCLREHIPFEEAVEQGWLTDMTTDVSQEPENTVEERLRPNTAIGDVLALLDERQAFIIVARLGLDGEKPVTLSQLSQYFGLTVEGVRQIEIKALKRLASVKDIRDIVDGTRQIGSRALDD